MCGSKSCLLATVPFPKWKRAPLATLPDHTSVLLGDFRRTVSRARISTSALPAFGASCAELHIAKNRVNTSKHWTITILVLPPVVARLSWQIMADIRILAGNNYQLLICRVTGHVVFGPISTSPVTAFTRHYLPTRHPNQKSTDSVAQFSAASTIVLFEWFAGHF